MIDTDQMIQRTTEEWKEFLRWQYNAPSYGIHGIVEYWFTDKFWNWTLAKFCHGKENQHCRITHEDAMLVYKSKAYFWKNPILQVWEVVKPPEQVMLEFMKLDQ